MSPIPSPDSVYEGVLLYIGLSSALVATIMALVTIFDWLKHLLWAGKTAGLAAQGVLRLTRLTGHDRNWTLPLVVTTQAALVALTIVNTQIWQRMLAMGVDDGMDYVPQDVLVTSFTVQPWTDHTNTAVLILLLTLLAANLGALTGGDWYVLTAAPLWPAGILPFCIAVGSAVYGLFGVGIGLLKQDGQSVAQGAFGFLVTLLMVAWIFFAWATYVALESLVRSLAPAEKV